jgi:dTDP-4-dehydrorhamnose 3,5-epimerase
MIFTPLKLKDAFLVEIQKIEDERGFFGRTWCETEFEQHGLEKRLVQCNVSYNQCKGTLRGMHYQAEPFGEVKLIRCTAGAIYDVIIDLRPTSPTFKEWVGIELTAQNRHALYIPAGFAHGFQTLTDAAEVFYQMSEFYEPSAARGVRWNDPLFAVEWPLQEPLVISDRDQQYGDFKL